MEEEPPLHTGFQLNLPNGRHQQGTGRREERETWMFILSATICTGPLTGTGNSCSALPRPPPAECPSSTSTVAAVS